MNLQNHYCMTKKKKKKEKSTRKHCSTLKYKENGLLNGELCIWGHGKAVVLEVRIKTLGLYCFK